MAIPALLFQCGEESSLVPRTFIEMIASTLDLVLVSCSCVCAYIEMQFVCFACGQQFCSFFLNGCILTKNKKNKSLTKIANSTV